ncbi:release factor glutamine methyltransferase [Flexivirga endophytica]|uniref:Release factor glutamine methyltransferase n=1 Tax=Flexivirga endophytica TaxID=1849103 RepID=A0A916SVD6_9MICO|nr:peptide chain release factor N(5)-glutamine methyltransferase [Flexivirga endophytica]GGB15321.1 release factor glutamine methyltransferase [Flexivirga endophytica]GHB40243.1 release factor glutamine methyltransferase [Flexivirga endophytica]
MTEVRALLASATERLTRAEVPSAANDAQLLLAHAWDISVGELQRRRLLGDEPPEPVERRLVDLLEQRAMRVPLQHLTGMAPFRGIELRVGPGVFVPRPETELLVDLVLAEVGDRPEAQVVDLCTGSGAIALAIKHEAPSATVDAVELDPMAHAWAARNAELLGLDVQVLQGPAESALPGREGTLDVVVSNPPYIPVGMVPIDPEVRDHDPEVALYGGSEDGLRIPLDVARRAHALLQPGGLLVMEHADSQGNSLPAALDHAGWSHVVDHLDLAGRPRAVTARRPG